MAANILVTTTNGFEGYVVTDYMGIVTGHSTLSSEAENQLVKAAKQKGANAVIGVNMTYAPLEAGSYDVIASGTAVKVSRSVNISDTVHKELYVTNYYTRLVPRPVKVILDGNSNIISMKIVCYNYNHEDIQSIRADVEFTNLYDERLEIKNVDFVFSNNNNLSVIESEYVLTEITPNKLQLLKDAKIVLNKYATSREICACNDVPKSVTLNAGRLEALKEQCGIDAVEKYSTDGMIWTCNCGHINEAGDEECSVCGRKQKDIMTDVEFNYEEMVDEMREKDSVVEIKDVLMDYIKDIDANVRLQLLEIMESGLQYEKTRGNMTETVVEKVAKAFEDASIRS
ncbi:MAG: heavy metal-binding domain-containing protein [Eubacterium sp.]|nr:heavy metal-binding domain-containing protein [Eubacterium sp.]